MRGTRGRFSAPRSRERSSSARNGPSPCSSGQRTNTASTAAGTISSTTLHVIAITRAQRDPATEAVPRSQGSRSKTIKGALRCLERHLARRFYRLHAEPPVDQQQAANRNPITEPELAATPESPARSERSNRSPQPSPTVCISQAGRSDQHPLRAGLQPPSTRGERWPPTSRAAKHRDRRRAGPHRNNRRVLSPSATLAQTRPTHPS
jgi:hypothetical protein